MAFKKGERVLHGERVGFVVSAEEFKTDANGVVLTYAVDEQTGEFLRDENGQLIRDNNTRRVSREVNGETVVAHVPTGKPLPIDAATVVVWDEWGQQTVKTVPTSELRSLDA